jgi:uncharacterized protein (UPF0332 family)
MVERINREEGAIRAKEEIERSEVELEAAVVLHEKGFYFKSIASSYYSIYHAARALLLLKGVDPKTHEGVERMFSLYYIKTEEFDLKVGKAIGRLMKMREEADYYPEIQFTSEESEEAIKMARLFLEKTKSIISK